MEEDKKNKGVEQDLFEFMQKKHMNAQEKFDALQLLAKKYNMPLEKLLKNIITEWVNEDKEKRFKKD